MSIHLDLKNIKIKVIWSNSDDNFLYVLLSNMFNHDKGINNIELVKDTDRADFIIILNYIPISQLQTLDYSKIILIETIHNINTLVPKEWIEFNKNNFLRVINFKEIINIGYYISSFSFQKLQNYIINKDCSTISSIVQKSYLQKGEMESIDFITFLQGQKYNIDVYGESIYPLSIKDNVSIVDLSKAFLPYKYTIIFEKEYLPDIFSEKILDAILCETFVFYYGCPNLEKYISSNCFIRLELSNYHDDLNLIKNTINAKTWEKNIENIRQEKERIMKEFNLLRSIEKILTTNK